MSWQQPIIEIECQKAKTDELRGFMVAYESLPQELHGYLDSVDQNVQVWRASLDKDIFDAVKKTYPSLWKNDKAVYFKQMRPYLTLDGVLAYAHKEHEGSTLDITVEPMQIGNIQMIKATVVSTLRGKSEGLAIVGKPEELEKNTSSAIRKALNYMGYGRFPTRATPYGEHATVKAFREFASAGKKIKESPKASESKAKE
jgi:hypothetical protein